MAARRQSAPLETRRLLRRRVLLAATLALAVSVGAWSPGQVQAPATATLPSRLTDSEFWRLIEDFSEPNGFFRSENLVSNEDTFQYVIPALQRFVQPGGVYLGVGPDQNFTYIAALRPRIAFIIDIRRGNLHLAPDVQGAVRALGRPRRVPLAAVLAPASAGPDDRRRPPISCSRPTRWRGAEPRLYEENLRAIADLLTDAPRLSARRRGRGAASRLVLGSFFAGRARSAPTPAAGGFGRGRYPTLSGSADGQRRSGTNRALPGHRGQFQGAQGDAAAKPDRAGRRELRRRPKALRAVGAYLAIAGATVTAFYTSNVEQYLFQDGSGADFARNVATLPVDESSTFIRAVSTTARRLWVSVGHDPRLDPGPAARFRRRPGALLLGRPVAPPLAGYGHFRRWLDPAGDDRMREYAHVRDF